MLPSLSSSDRRSWRDKQFIPGLEVLSDLCLEGALSFPVVLGAFARFRDGEDYGFGLAASQQHAGYQQEQQWQEKHYTGICFERDLSGKTRVCRHWNSFGGMSPGMNSEAIIYGQTGFSEGFPNRVALDWIQFANQGLGERLMDRKLE
jgi:hypothetical protein